MSQQCYEILQPWIQNAVEPLAPDSQEVVVYPLVSSFLPLLLSLGKPVAVRALVELAEEQSDLLAGHLARAMGEH